LTAEAKFLAFDLGAESGRAVAGHFNGDTLRLDDAHRFPTRSVRTIDTLSWDVLGLFHELKQGLGMAVATHGPDFEGIGIDTWGVDFGLLGRGDTLLGNPRHYRDHHTEGILDTAFEIVGRDELFDRTGIQFMRFNTLFQLLALKRANSPLLEQAETLLMMPDLLNFWFTGVKTTEFSIASTSQMVDPRTRSWDADLVERFGLPSNLLTDLVPTATKIGMLRSEIASAAGCRSIPIFAPGEHDTASAVVAVPAQSKNYAYISSGTWSLMGVETLKPHISEETRAYNFTNEGGACGTIRLLKNIMGLWLVQGCRSAEARRGKDYSYGDLAKLAEEAAPFASLIEPDATDFLAPEDMRTSISAFCERTGQAVPADIGAAVRCCLESLALKYRWTLERLEAFRGARIEVIHIVGGGAQNRLLCQLAADATNRPVTAGPVEATAAGNLLMQALGCGYIGSLDQARDIVRRSFPLDTYSPCASRDRWESAYATFEGLRTMIGKTD